MNINYRKSITWIMLAIYFMLAPVPLLNDGNLVLCIEDTCADCHGGSVLASREANCEPVGDVCEKSCGYVPQISDSTLNECFCCVEIPTATYIKINIPLSRTQDASGDTPIVLTPSLPDQSPVLNKISFSSVPNLHLISTQKTLRSVVLII
jgi:hypothetical protein